ncbi:MAG TPA: citramalate synthase [Propionibacteriaceae bacterium]
MTPEAGFQLYDTTLRDGAQGESLTLSVDDKLTIARRLDALGVGFIEGGWPGAIPKDTEFYRRAATELELSHATLTAFGSTRPAGGSADGDPQLAALLAAGTEVVTIVAKSHPRHVLTALRTSLAENLEMIADSVGFLVGQGRRVFLDAEHFFDGYLTDPGYAYEVLDVATASGAEVVVLCDTNGGMLPPELYDIVRACAEQTQARLGIHCHDDGGCAVANTLAAVDAGAIHAQVTANGYGERCGNANLFSVAGNLVLKKKLPVLPAAQLGEMRATAEFIGTIAATGVAAGAPFVGGAAFAHKAGLHTSALRLDPGLYQHIEPGVVGNTSRTIISEMAGRASIELKAAQLGHQVPAGSHAAERITRRVKALESEGCAFAGADSSFELLLTEELYGHDYAHPFELVGWETTTRSLSATSVDTRVSVTLSRGTSTTVSEAYAAGPLDALFEALTSGVRRLFPHSHPVELVDVTFRHLPGSGNTPARVRALVTCGEPGSNQTWRSVGVAPHLLGAFVSAVHDALSYGLLGATGSHQTSTSFTPNAQAATNVMGEVA